MIEETISQDIIFKGKVIRVLVDKVRLPDGTYSEREIVERINGVSILPINKKNEVLMIKQYRHAMGKIILRLPGGGIDLNDKAPIDAAQRELFEEVGYKARKMELLFESGGSGTIRQKVYHFLATDLYKPNENQYPDAGELLEIYPVKFDKAINIAQRAGFHNPAFNLMILMSGNNFKNK